MRRALLTVSRKKKPPVHPDIPLYIYSWTSLADVYFTAAYGWMGFRPVLLSFKGQIRSCPRAIPLWHTYEESKHHIYFLNLLNYWVIAFYLSALTQFRPIYAYERVVPGVCAPHLDDLRR